MQICTKSQTGKQTKNQKQTKNHQTKKNTHENKINSAAPKLTILFCPHLSSNTIHFRPSTKILKKGYISASFYCLLLKYKHTWSQQGIIHTKYVNRKKDI